MLNTSALAENSLIATQQRAKRLTRPTLSSGAQRGIRDKLLIVDDDPGIRRALTRVVERAGYQALQADSVSTAIDLGLEIQPRFALVDLHLPKGSGLEVVRHLKSNLAELHVTVLSGDPTTGARVESFDAGADDYVAKPVHMPELMRRLAAAKRGQNDRRELSKEKQRAEQLYVYAKEMASFLAHDLNNGFCVALANLDYLKFADNVDEDHKKAFGATLQVLNRMSVLTDNFLDIERLEEGALIPRRSSVSMRGLLENVVALNQTRKSDGIDATIDCDPALQVYLDAPLVERVLHNIFGNAMRYAHSDTTLNVGAKLVSGGDHPRLMLQVSNNGPDIPQAIASAIFDKYDKPRDGKSRHGIGLYFCRLVCEAHDGTIGVSSQDGTTTFTMEITIV